MTISDIASADIVSMFSAVAANSPESVALEVDGSATSYGTLDQMAGRVANRLQEAGCVAGDRVLLVAERSRLTYAAYLGILRAGAAVLPVGPREAKSRLSLIAAESGSRFIIHSSVHAVASLEGIEAFVWPSAGPDIEDPSDEVESQHWAPRGDAGAYVLYTSGSTGTPKGVPISHENVMAWLPVLADQFGLTASSRVSSGIELTFDPSIITLLGAWYVGATAVIPNRSEALRPATFIRDHGITHWTGVPSSIDVAYALSDLEPDAMPSLVTAIFGGESMSGLQARRWLHAARGSRLLHVYGPTELTVYCSANVSGLDALAHVSDSDILPVGLPLPGVEHVLLDANLAPSREGQLAIRGPQRFAGYVDAGMNEGRFAMWERGRPTADLVRGVGPTAQDWFLTGDVMEEVNGQLLFRGRGDQQIKLRGFRVELGEVEAKVAVLEGIEAAAAVVLGEGSAARLVVFIVASVAVLRRDIVRRLGVSLPHYMLPSDIIQISSIPRTENGKIDRRALALLAEQPKEETGL